MTEKCCDCIVLGNCLDYWQLRFVALHDAWRTGDNENALAALERFLAAKDGDRVTEKIKEIDAMRERLKELEGGQ